MIFLAGERIILPNDPHYANAWLTGENRYLKRYYGVLPARTLARELGRTERAVHAQAGRLHISGVENRYCFLDQTTYRQFRCYVGGARARKEATA